MKPIAWLTWKYRGAHNLENPSRRSSEYEFPSSSSGKKRLKAGLETLRGGGHSMDDTWLPGFDLRIGSDIIFKNNMSYGGSADPKETGETESYFNYPKFWSIDLLGLSNSTCSQDHRHRGQWTVFWSSFAWSVPWLCTSVRLIKKYHT